MYLPGLTTVTDVVSPVSMPFSRATICSFRLVVKPPSSLTLTDDMYDYQVAGVYTDSVKRDIASQYDKHHTS